jgi:AcrR family transcriptional regulator
MAAKPYHHGSLEAALLEAALDVVTQNGVAALSLRDLARHVGVSPSAAYRHFPSRDHLVSRVSQVAREALGHSLVAARATVQRREGTKRHATELLEALGRAYVQFALANPMLFDAAFTRCDVPPAKPDEPDAWGELVAAIEAMIAAGVTPPNRRHDGVMIAWSAVHGLSTILTSSIWPIGLDSTREVDAVVKGVVRSLS